MRYASSPVALALALALAFALACPAAALEPHQAAAIDRIAGAPPPGKSADAALAGHYAMLLWVEDYCNGRSLESVRRYIVDKVKDRDAFEAAWLATTDMLGKTNPSAMCPLALEQYGPEGATIKGAWAPKQ